MLLPRVLTALFLAPVFLYLIHLGNLPYQVFVVGIAALALHEYAMVLWLGGRGVQRTLTVVGGALVAAAAAFAGQESGAGLAQLALTLVVCVAVLSELVRKEHSLDRAALSLFGVLFVGWTLAHLALIRATPNGRAWTFLLFAAVWTCDSVAYFTGNALGKHKLAQVISPKKTWEGAAGGLIGAVVCCQAARYFFLPDVVTPAGAWFTGILVGTLGQVSDLAQSLVKRAAGAKDSANLLPGHGGVFDRMDSFLLLAPVFYYALVFLNW